MRKNWILVVAAVCITVLYGCKAKESMYKAVYEQAKAKELTDNTVKAPEAEPPTPSPVVAEQDTVAVQEPQQTTSVVEVPVVKVTKERVTTIDADDANKLKMYNVVLGSFSISTNAKGLKESLVADGYNAFVAQNATGWYRVIVASFDDRESATAFRESIQQKYVGRFNDAWLLINQ